MVQIERPAGQVAVGQPSVDSQAITKEAIDADEAMEMAGESAQTSGSETGRSEPGGFSGSDALESDSSIDSTAPPAWQSERTQRTRQIALVVALSLSGLLTAVAVFSWFVRSWRATPVAAEAEVAANDPLNKNPPASNELAEPGNQTEPDEAVTADSSNADAASDDASSDGASSDGASGDPSSTPEATTTVPDQVSASVEDPSPTDGPNSASTEDGNAKQSAPPDDLIPQSPLDALADNSPEGTAEDAAVQDLLQKYMHLLPEAGATEAPTLVAPPTMDEIKIEGAAEIGDDPLVRSKPKQLNMKADLAIRLALDTDGYPLTDLLLLVSQITGVPIQIDWVSFDLAGIDVDSTVSASKQWQSARQILDAIATKLNAEFREEPTLLVLTVTDETYGEMMNSMTDLSDFGDSQSTAVSVLNSFLQAEEGEAKLKIGPSREEQQLAGLAIESLRRMRGLQPKVEEQRLRRWAQPAQEESIDWPLISGGDGGPQMLEPIAFAGFLRRFSRRNDASAVVNWYDANRRAVGPEFLVLPHAGPDAATTINRTLAPHLLQVRQVDAGHWWIGSESTYDRLTAVVWTAPLGENRDRFTQRINSIMKGASPDVFRLSFDEQSDRALLLLPRYIVRQLRKITLAVAAN